MSESVLVACPHCHALNRVPRERFDQGPSCGKCHLALFAALPAALSAESFDAHVMRAGLPVVVDFWAPWCGPCRMMAPHFEAAARQLEPRVRLAKLDTEVEPALGARHGIRSIPTMVLFHQGRELARHSGAMPGAQIVAWVRDHLPPA